MLTSQEQGAIRAYLLFGGPWIRAVRDWLTYNRHGPVGNGETITWGSDEMIDPPLTAKEAEELALDVAVAAIEQYITYG